MAFNFWKLEKTYELLAPIEIDFGKEMIWKLLSDKFSPFIGIQTRLTDSQESFFYRYNVLEKTIDLKFKTLHSNFNLDLQEVANGHLLLHRFDKKNPVMANNLICLSNKKEEIAWESYRYKLKSCKKDLIEVADTKLVGGNSQFINYVDGSLSSDLPKDNTNKEPKEWDTIECNEIKIGGEWKKGNFLFIDKEEFQFICSYGNQQEQEKSEFWIQSKDKIIFHYELNNVDPKMINFRIVNEELLLIKNKFQFLIFSL